MRWSGAWVMTCAALLIGSALHAHAAYDPSQAYVESAAVIARYPDPDVVIATPGLRAGRTDFTSHEELLAFIEALTRQGAASRNIGRSQEGRAIPLLVFARGAGAQPAELAKSHKPTVLIIGQQHGNEPAGGEAALAFASRLVGEDASLLDRVNVLIVPRANPDGAYHFVRGLANGSDVNRDHLLGETPEGQALARIFVEYQPDVVLDCHEFGVKQRWFEKFGALQAYDALVQYATIANLPVAISEASERWFRLPLVAALESAGLRQSWYYTSSYNMEDRRVSMGGVVPDTGRNIAGLRNAISFLIETRGVGIGRAHFKRRVYTHLVAMRSVVASAGEHAGAIVLLEQRTRELVAADAGRGELIVEGTARTERHSLTMVDPETGEDKLVEVDWRSALQIDPRLKRSRPQAYVLASSESAAAAKLRNLGASVYRIAQEARVDGERYRIVSAVSTLKDDVRRNDEEGTIDVIRLETATEPAAVQLHRGDFYVPLDQPLANVIAAALEPDTQSSYAANHAVHLRDALSPDYMPLYRVRSRPAAAMVLWDSP